MNPTQILQGYEYIRKMQKKQIKCHWADTACGLAAQCRCGPLALWCPRPTGHEGHGPLLCGLVAHSDGSGPRCAARHTRAVGRHARSRQLHRRGRWPATCSAQMERRRHGAYLRGVERGRRSASVALGHARLGGDLRGKTEER
jgi:hypothetical protein